MAKATDNNQNNNQNTRVIFVERETYEKDGKTYFSYYIKGMVRGKEVKAQVAPHDVGGYAVLDIVFDGADKAELFTTPYEIRDEKTKRTVKGVTYGVRSYDADGQVYECPVKPMRSSDKSFLQMLLR